MIGQSARKNNNIADGGVGGGDVCARFCHTDPGGVDEYFVTASSRGHFGVAAYDFHPCLERGISHGLHDRSQIFDGEPLFENQPHRQGYRLCAAHGQIVDGAVDGQIADVAAREKNRVNNITIGSEIKIPLRRGNAGGIFEAVSLRCASEFRHNDFFDKPLAHTSARTVAKQDDIVTGRHLQTHNERRRRRFLQMKPCMHQSGFPACRRFRRSHNPPARPIL